MLIILSTKLIENFNWILSRVAPLTLRLREGSIIFRRGPTYYGGTKGSVNDTTPEGYRVVHGNGFKTNEQSSFRVIVQNEVKETNVVHIATNADWRVLVLEPHVFSRVFSWNITSIAVTLISYLFYEFSV